MRKYLWYLFLALLVFFLIQSPREAAKLVEITGENAGELFGAAAQSLNKFLRSLVA